MLHSFPIFLVEGSKQVDAVVAHGTQLAEVPAFQKTVLKV
jgi:hypothetical protein